MKKTLYVFLFTLLGLMLSTLLHAAIELPALWLITGDIERYGGSFVWQNWGVLHTSIGALLWVLGGGGGVWGGFHFWQILYVEERYGKPRF